MARNRKRAKERRGRRSPDSAIPPPGLTTARAEQEDGAPDPIEHASADVELANAQVALGRPELAGDLESRTVGEMEPGTIDGVEPELEELDENEFDAEPAELSFRDERGSSSAGGGALAARESSAPAGPLRAGNRVINFLQGSWRELQRVQWPDRRAVMQATGVVIGFVIVAGVFLGVSDFLAGKLMNFVLK